MCNRIPWTAIAFAGLTLTEAHRLRDRAQCSKYLDFSMCILYGQLTAIFTLASILAHYERNQVSNLFTNCLAPFFFVLFGIGTVANFIFSFVFLVIMQVKTPGCLPIYFLIHNWIVTSIGVLGIVTGLVLMVVFLVKDYRTQKRRLEMQREVTSLFEVIYDPKAKIEHLIEKYREQLETEPLYPTELTILHDYFGRIYNSDQDGIDEEAKECCIICLMSFKRDEVILVHPGCNHLYHQTCIGAWHDNNLPCPMCKRNVRFEMIDAIRNKKGMVVSF